MSKHKRRIIGAISILVIIACTVVFPQTKAKDKTLNKTEEKPLTCVDLAEKYGLYIKVESNGYKVIKDNNAACGNDKEKKEAKFKITAINGTAIDSNKFTELNSTTNEIIISKDDAPLVVTENENKKTYSLIVQLKKISDGSTTEETIDIKYTGEEEEAGRPTITRKNDNYHDQSCQRLRSACKDDFCKNALPNCYNEGFVVVNYTEEELKTIVDNILELWNIYQNQLKVGNQDFNTLFNDVYGKAKKNNKVTNPENKITLSCPYNLVKRGISDSKSDDYVNKYGDVIDPKMYYLNKDYFYAESKETTGTVKYTYNFAPGNTKTESYNACERTCTEAVKVEYGPPVASKAGLCFEYKVKVTSYVKCSAKPTAPRPNTYNNYCNPAPICYSINGVLRQKEQAGPKEEFDSCIQTCDSGKYTEACSIKCYNKVYGRSIKLAVNYEDVKAIRLADENQENYTLKDCLNENEEYFGCYTYTTNNGKKSIDWHSLKNYDKKGNRKSTNAWNDRFALGRWYLDRVYLQENGAYNLENPDFTRKATKGYDITGISKCDGQTYCGNYVSDEQGIYRANYGSGALCTDNCWWRTDQCKETDYMNPGTLEADAKRNQEEYKKAVQACIGSATCSSRQAEFNISLKYDADNKEKPTDVNFPHNTFDKLNANKDNNDIKTENRSSLLDYAGCYKDKTIGNHYMTEWSFPGTYIHNKTGEISFEEPQAKDGWYFDDKKFCMPLNAKSVNKKWWEWYKLDSKKYSEDEIQKEINTNDITSSNGYNITAKAKNFGYFGWNFDIQCFYGLNNRNTECDPEKEICDTNGLSNYTFRTVDLANLFPNAKKEDEIDQNKRDIAFNWTSKAAPADKKQVYYKIDPSELKKRIETVSDDIYSSDSYLDYRFYLTPRALAEIKKYNNEATEKGEYLNKYATWNGKSEIRGNYGVVVYESNLFRDNVGINSRMLTGIDGSIVKLGTPGVNNE